MVLSNGILGRDVSALQTLQIKPILLPSGKTHYLTGAPTIQ
jgi:hypothetical protein